MKYINKIIKTEDLDNSLYNGKVSPKLVFAQDTNTVKLYKEHYMFVSGIEFEPNTPIDCATPIKNGVTFKTSLGFDLQGDDIGQVLDSALNKYGIDANNGILSVKMKRLKSGINIGMTSGYNICNFIDFTHLDWDKVTFLKIGDLYSTKPFTIDIHLRGSIDNVYLTELFTGDWSGVTCNIHCYEKNIYDYTKFITNCPEHFKIIYYDDYVDPSENLS